MGLLPNLNAVIGSTNIVTNVWYHIALVKSGTNAKIYVNGVLDGTNTSAPSNVGSDTQVLYIGYAAGQPTNECFNGYLSNLRITKGVQVYTGNFTVPNSPLQSTQLSSVNINSITGTQCSLLMNTSSNNTLLIDNSTYGRNISNGGGTNITFGIAQSPF
jgi:hypothetical protein